MYKGLTKKEIKIAKHYENMTEAEAEAEHEWAVANGLSFPDRVRYPRPLPR